MLRVNNFSAPMVKTVAFGISYDELSKGALKNGNLTEKGANRIVEEIDKIHRSSDKSEAIETNNAVVQIIKQTNFAKTLGKTFVNFLRKTLEPPKSDASPEENEFFEKIMKTGEEQHISQVARNTVRSIYIELEQGKKPEKAKEVLNPFRHDLPDPIKQK